MSWNSICVRAVEIAVEAGQVLTEGLARGKEIARKSSQVDLVTQYDRLSEQLIVSRLQHFFPDHGVVAEEGGGSVADEELRWYVDPLDGTNNFASRLPHFAVSMALYQGARPLVAVTYDPGRDECFRAVTGEGAFLECAGECSRLQVSSTGDLLNAMVATGFPYDRHTSSHDNVEQLRAFLKRTRGVRRAGSATLDLAYVAAGRLDGFWEFKLGPWDVAAGVLLVIEAGGQVTSVGGSPVELGPRVSLVASNGSIHKPMLDLLACF